MPNPLKLLKAMNAERLMQRALRGQLDKGVEHLGWQNAGRSGMVRGTKNAVRSPLLTLLDDMERPGERVVLHTHPMKGSMGLPSLEDVNDALSVPRHGGPRTNEFVARMTPLGETELSYYMPNREIPVLNRRRALPTSEDMFTELTSDAARRATYDDVLAAAGLFDEQRFAPDPALYLYSRRMFEPDRAGGTLNALLPVQGVDVAPLYEDFYKFARRRGWTEKAEGGLLRAPKRGRMRA